MLIPNVPVKEFEKYGFVKCKGGAGKLDCYYLCVSRGVKMIFVSPKTVDIMDWRDDDDRIHKKANCRYSDKRSCLDILYDLIKAGLIVRNNEKMKKEQLEMGKEYVLRIKEGFLNVMVSIDPEYPGINIEYVSDKENTLRDDELTTRPGVLIESREGKDLRALIWGDSKSEDYSHVVNFACAEDMEVSQWISCEDHLPADGVVVDITSGMQVLHGCCMQHGKWYCNGKPLTAEILKPISWRVSKKEERE